MKTYESFPPAKINLVLRVFQSRRGLLHHLHSLMQTISWGDRLALAKRVRPGIEFRCRSWASQDPRANLAYRAAEAVMREAGIRDGLSIHLEKRVPDAAGLGGGSSDAAEVLKGLRRLWGVSWPAARWNRLALSLGSDVPFFLSGGLAEVKGVGERVRCWSTKKWGPLLVVTFPERLSTAWAYRRLDASWKTLAPGDKTANLTKGREAVRMWRRSLKTLPQVYNHSARGEGEKVKGHGAPPPGEGIIYNDFSPIVRARFRGVQSMWQWLEDQSAGAVGMTGKGPTLFMLLRDPDQGAHLQARLQAEFPACRAHKVWAEPSLVG